jgi:hypothetical protein
VNAVFQIVFQFLTQLSATTGLTYEEVNVLLYYFCVPLAFVVLIDRILRTWVCSVCFLAAWAYLLFHVSSLAQFSKSAFDWSVLFLQQFSKFGWDYTEASVIICVVIPVLAFLALWIVGTIVGRRRKKRSGESSQGR